MKRLLPTLLLLPATSLLAHAEQLVPAGSVLQCTVSEKISSKVTNVGDPVICQLSRAELYGRSVLPYGSYLVGRFEEYRDPGHFVGKGWMELKFDRLVVGNDTVIPLTARVIASSGKNPVDKLGRIDGSGHATKDTVEWLIPVLWPLDLINLPRRGPSPVLKPETRLTLKLIDDVGIPTKTEVQHQPELISRFNYSDPTPPVIERQAERQVEQQPAPIERSYAPQYAPQPQYQPQYQPTYAPQPSPTVVVVQAAPAAAPTIIQQAAPAQQPPPAVVYNNYPPHPVYAYPPPYGYAYPPPAYRGYYRPY